MIQSAVILAGGAGARMWPFAEVRNKCAMPVANLPNVRRLYEDLAALGVQRIVVVLGSHSGSIRHALLGVSPEPVFVDQPAGGGTAGAACVGLRSLPDERAVIVYGDVCVAPSDLRRVMDAPGETGCAGAVLVDQPAAEDGADWHVVSLENGRLARIVGHDAGARLRWSGIAVVGPGFARVLDANPGRMMAVPVGGMPPMEPDFAQSLNDWPAEIVAVHAERPVVDMDKPWHVLQANMAVAERLTSELGENRIHPTARVHDGADIAGCISVGAGSEIGKRVVIEGPAIVGDDTRIVNGAILRGSNIVGSRTRLSDYCLVDPHTVVGSDCIVGHGAEMSGVMFDGSYLYHYCEISGLVGASVDIGAATVCGTLRFDDRDAEHRVRGRRERPGAFANASYFGDHSRTGVNVITMPGAKIGAYSCVGAGIVVYEDVPSRTLLLLKQETVTRPWGPDRYGW
ncbi:MAG: NTP transferase domain-containing protein [Chthonomonadales bacterium]|nr:NTP transferase domain-containing protein [Chthonomonadales bacterium]